MNSLYRSMNPTPQPNMMDQYQQFRQNPVRFLLNRHVNIPQQFQNNPQEAVQYLMNNGQMSQAQFQKLSRMAQMMGINL